MAHIRPIESIRSSAREAANWLTARRAIGMTTLTLAVMGVGYGVEQFISDERDASEAVPLIKADGFSSSGRIEEAIEGGSVDIQFLAAGDCSFDDVEAHLAYRDGKVVKVDNYQLTYGYIVPNVPLGYSDHATATITVQNMAGLRQAAPSLHC